MPGMQPDCQPNTALYVICESLDNLMNIDYHARGMVGRLYRAARERQGRPLTLAAASAIIHACLGHRALGAGGRRARFALSTGFMIRSAGAPETDGLTGAALLARGISAATEALPVLLCEPAATQALAGACRGAGLRVTEATSADAVDVRAALAAAEVIRCDCEGCAVMVPAPMDWEEAHSVAGPFIDEVEPCLWLTIERPGRNRQGVHHNSWGKPMSDITAKVDVLYAEAARRGVRTVAIGDLGNELGMGALTDVVAGCTPFGTKCVCGCGGGVAAADDADVTVVGSVSDDVAYAVLAALQAMNPEIPGILADPESVERVLVGAVEAGAVDGITGRREPSIDMLPLSVHLSLATLMQAAVEVGTSHTRARPEYLNHLAGESP